MATGTYEWQSETARKHVGQGRAEDGIKVLTVLGLAVNEDRQHRIHACEDLDQLDEWLERATSAEDLFL